jgi:hypothetical protein
MSNAMLARQKRELPELITVFTHTCTEEKLTIRWYI